MNREKRKSERRRSTRYAADPVPQPYVPSIQINVLEPTPSPKEQALRDAVAAFERVQYAKPFSERHPELGKMFNCVGCGHRHGGPKCELQYAVNSRTGEVMIAPKTRKGTLGAAMFARRRFRPHRNQKTLLTIHIAKENMRRFEEETGRVPDPVISAREAIRQVRGRRQSTNPFRLHQVMTGLVADDSDTPVRRLEVAGMSACGHTLNSAAPAPVHDEPRKRLSWIPTFSLHLGHLHIWLGRQFTDGRNVYALIHESFEPRLSASLHWLTDETPMFSLHLYPVVVAHLFWMHSHDISKELS